MSTPITTPATTGCWIHRAETALGHLHEIQALGFDWIAIKLWEDGALYGDVAAFKQLCADAATISMPVLSWGYSRPHEIDAQIAVASDNLPAGAAGIIIDAEGEWETGGTSALAHQLCHGIAEAIGHRCPLHLSSFYTPQMHPQFPYAAFLEHCASFMPQSYQEGATPISSIINRTRLQAAPAATTAHVACTPTINNTALLAPMKAAGFAALSVWLWDGSPGSDAGVLGHEAAWKAAIAAFKC